MGSINDTQILNRYAFVKGNPVSDVDPFGLSALDSDYQGTGKTASDTMIRANRKPGKTPPKSWPPLPDNLAGKKPKWNPNGYWEGAKGDHTWDDRSHGSVVNRGNGPQDGHWDDERSNGRWDRNGTPLPSHTNNTTFHA